jgi:hypothetical protein
MRQVFSSPRLQNVEGVADLLREAGIEVRISDGRSYRSGWSGRRSYREDLAAAPQAAVWVVKSEDQPRARALLRDAGLLHDTTMPTDSYLPAAGQSGERTGWAGGGRGTRYKIMLLVAIAVVIALAFIRGPGVPPGPATAPVEVVDGPLGTAPTAMATAPAPPAQWRVPVPTALAALMARDALAGRDNAAACLRVDGEAPTAPLLDALGDTALSAGADCTGDALRVEVRDYRTDGSGRGTVRVETTAPGAAPVERRYRVRRLGDDWQVEGEATTP